jgi:hypothetical protein
MSTHPTPIVILAARDDLSYLLINHLAARMPVGLVIFEAAHTGKMLRHRLKKLGAWKVFWQLTFLVIDRLLIRRQSRGKITRLLHGYAITPPDGRLLVLDVDSVNSAEVITALHTQSPSVVVVSGTGIISRKVLALPMSFINIHVGITPRYRGVHGGFWAVYEGRPDLAGATLHRVDPGVDTGGILRQMTITVEPDDTYRTLPVKQYLAALDPLVEVIQAAQAGVLTTTTRADLESQQWYSPTPWDYLQFLRRLRSLR